MTRRRLIFQGHVQGVGFRATARSIAARFPISGWVRNEPDGTVSMEVQGSECDVDEFLMDLDEQLGGYITSKNTSDIEPDETESGFDIRA